MTLLLRFYDACELLTAAKVTQNSHARRSPCDQTKNFLACWPLGTSLPGLADRSLYLVLGRILGAESRCCSGARTQEHCEERARPGSALNIKKSAVTIKDVLDDREPKPGSTHLARSRGIDT